MSESLNNMNINLTLDDIEDLPEFDTPPAGTYNCLLSLDFKELKKAGEDSGTPAIIFDYTLEETIELGTQEVDRPHLKGQKFSIPFTRLEYAKKYLKQLADMLGVKTIAEIVEGTKDILVQATFAYRDGADDKKWLKLKDQKIL